MADDERRRPDLLLTDLMMPGTDGTGLIEELAGTWPPVVRDHPRGRNGRSCNREV